jgi:hypothetical protein
MMLSTSVEYSSCFQQSALDAQASAVKDNVCPGFKRDRVRRDVWWIAKQRTMRKLL